VVDNYKLVIEYDGTGYHGWQRQAADRSIQGTIEAALQTMTRQKITLIGSGRTDAGVHALGQVANFTCDTNISPAAFARGLNSLLPADIVIRSCSLAPLEFHARYAVKSKLYQYDILNSTRPAAIGRQYHWWIRSPLNVAAMQAAVQLFIGQHDFKAFEGAGSPRAHTVRNVIRAELFEEKPDVLCFQIQATGFLRFMVRNIVGTIVEVGRGNLPPERVRVILGSKDRNQAGPTAPPQGLCLVEVFY
jgi:tRNA pseudouridine38-40 synthase